ncbi:MAG: hypothetical protein EAX95_08390 [Candidatus Thorarchaeota archaeon]|nr:hypothetical protein [Candidatus Thorarchaeota archaeon]
MKYDSEVREALQTLQLLSEDGIESRDMLVLTTLLRMQKEPLVHFSFSEIFSAFEAYYPSAGLKKPAVHKALQWLVENQLVRLESQTKYRKKYLADANTLMAGLENLKVQVTKELQVRKRKTEETLRSIETCDCKALSQGIMAIITGKQVSPSSRFVRGMEEFDRVTDSTIYDRAGKGDVIRNSLIWIGPFTEGATERFGRVVDVAKRGAEVRYGAHPDLLARSDTLRDGVPSDWIQQTLAAILALRKEGKLIDLRILEVDRKGYQFASLNNDVMAFFISEDPLTAAWVTREFNPDLIDNAIADFDRLWERGVSVLELTGEKLQSMGISTKGHLQAVLLEGLKKKESDNRV